MSSKSSNKRKVLVRPWTTHWDDLKFSLEVRNHPDLMKWFRQDRPITPGEQLTFIEDDKEYNGRIIEANGVKVGLCGVKSTGEFTIGVLPQFQGKGISTKVMQLLTANNKGVWSEVFVGNPALEWFISVCGFKITGVSEKAYYKKNIGYIDTVKIHHE